MDSATIVSASLSDKELRDSVTKLVNYFDDQMKIMAVSANITVDSIEKKLKSLGNIKIDSGGTADGGSSRRTKSLSEESLKAKEVTTSYDQMQSVLQRIAKDNSGLKDIRTFNKEELQSYIDLLRKLQAEYVRVNTQEGGGAKSDQIKRDMAELEKIIQGYQTILRNVEAINSRQGTIDVKKWTQDIGAVDDRYKKLVRWYTVLEKEDQRRIANEEKANQKRLAELNKEEAARQKMIESARKAEEKYQNAVLKTAFNKIIDMPSNNIDQMRSKLERLQTILANIRELGILSPKDISNAETEIGKLRGNIQQIEKIERERIEAEKRFVVEQAKEIEQTQTLEGRIKSLAQIARERLKEEQSSYTDLQAYGKAFRVFDASSSFAKGLSIEEQIKNALTEEKSAREGVAQSAQQQSGATQNVVKAQQEESAAIRKNFRDYDSLKQAIASVLGIKSENVHLQGAEISSINVLSDRLKQLRAVYNQLGTDDRHSETGKALIAQIQIVERQMDRARKELSRPIDLKSAFGLSEKTLDDISYKMRQLASYKMGLNIKDPKAMEEMRQVDTAINRLQKNYDKLMTKNNQMIASNTALGRSWNYMKNRLAFYLTVSTGMTLVRDLARVRSEYEMNEKALGTLLNSAERGTRIFNELSNMALVSPYTLIELSAAAKQLTAYDIAAKDVVDTTRRLADISAAVGIPVERLTYALGQVKAYGHLTSQDARQFLNAGVPLVKELSNRFSELEGKMVSTADVYDRMKKHAISYNDVLAVLTSMTDEGGRFFDYQAKMAETLKVRLANLTLAYNNMLNDMGKANGGAFTIGIKGLTQLLKHWRKIERVLGTVVVGIGAYRAATLLAGITTKSATGASAAAWLSTAASVRSAKDAVTFFSMAVKSVPFAGWATAVASIVSYLVLFNNSSDETKQKLQDIATAFEGIRKEATDLFADAISTDSLGTQLTKLKDMLELAETELGVTIPINIEDVNKNNIKQKLNEAKQKIEEYLNFSQRFSENAVDTNFNEKMNEFGAAAKSTYTSISESINAVKVALKELADEGKASKRDIEILNELSVAPKDGESRINHLQKLVGLYEELGIIGKKETVVPVGGTQSVDNMILLQHKQEESLNRLRITNKTVYENMLKDVQVYYSSSSFAEQQFIQQVERVAKSIDIKNMPVDQRTIKLEAAIDQEASKNNWNEFEKEFAKQIANTKYGTTIEISENSKKDSKTNLQQWQKDMQAWADKNGIKFELNFIENEDEKTYADRMLQAAKDAQGKLDVQRRKMEVGTGSQDAVDTATQDYKNARLLALKAGADLSTLDKKTTAAAKKAESELSRALKDELSIIEKVRSIYKELTKEGASHADAIKSATEGWEESVNAINKILTKNGLKGINLNDFVGIENPREILKTLQSQLDEMVKRGAKPSEIQVLQEKIKTVKVDAEKYDLTKITKGLNNELDKLKDEYELAVELDANPELGNMFMDLWGINEETLPHTAQEYASRYTKSLNKYLAEHKKDLVLPNLLNVTSDDMAEFQKLMEAGKLEEAYFDLIKKGYEATHDARKKEATDSIKEYQNLLQKYSEYQYKLTQIAKQANNERKALVVRFGNEQQKEEARKIVKNLDVEKDQQKIEELNNQLSELIEQVAGDNELTVQLSLSIDNKEAKEKAKALWDNFKNSDSYTIMFDDLKRASTGALNQLGESFEEIKPKIKESPEAMKELMNAYKQLREELTARDPFGAMVTSMERMRKASANVEIAEKELDDANKTVKKNEDQLALLRKTEPKNIKAIEAAEKNLTKAKKDASEKQKNLTNAQNQQVAAKDDYKKAISESAKVIDKLGQSISSVGSQIEGTAGQVLQLIGDIMSFVKTVSDGIVSTSETASKALQAIETASVILMIISAAIKIVQQISELLSDSFGEYEKFAEKQSEINKLKDSVVEYQMAVLEARMEEENWFSTSNLKKLKNYYKIGSEALDAYKDKLFQAQAVYENESGSGWLTKLGAQASKTIAGIVGGVNSLFGLEGTFIDDISTKLAQFGWANVAGGMIGMNMYLENLLWNKKYDKSYEEGLTAAWQNLRIETREASKGFLGTGIGGHNQETRDLIEWAREELGMELFLEDLTLNEEAYKVIMDKWADKLVGETKDTLEALHEYTEKWKEYIEQLEEYVDSLYSPLIDNMSDAMWDWFDEGKNALDSFKEYSKKTFRDIVSDMMKTIILSNFGNKYAEDISDLYTEYVKGGMGEKQLIEKVGVRTNELMDSFQRNIPVLEEVMNTASQVFKQYGIELKDIAEESSLSALQQGISQISETTANALESYMNSVNQQVYYHSTLLEQIRDAIMGTDSDIQLGVQGQILLQLQTSYQTQQAIQSILEGWSSPNGMSVRVEMV